MFIIVNIRNVLLLQICTHVFLQEGVVTFLLNYKVLVKYDIYLIQ